MQLSVMQTLSVVMRTIWDRRGDFFKALLLTAVLILALEYIMAYPLWKPELDQMHYWYLQIIGAGILISLLWALLAISCHRIFLEDPDLPTPFDGVWVGRRQLSYILRAIVVSFPFFIWGLINAWDMYVWGMFTSAEEMPLLAEFAMDWVLILPVQYLSSRLALTLPAAAVGEPITFAESWSLSRGNGWRITAILLAAPIAYDLLVLILYPVLHVDHIAIDVLLSICWLVLAVIAVGGLSYSYKWILSQQPEPTT